ncbi:MAG: ABC transporter permease [Parvibaculaceae bacterium]
MSAFLAFLFGRIGSAAVTLLGVTVVIFTAIHLIPGSFEEILVPHGSPEFRKEVAERLGLDQPLIHQYVYWVGNLTTGDLGTSLITSQPVWTEFAGRIPVTLELATLAALTAILLGVPLGFAAGLAGTGRFTSTMSRLFSGFSMSVPDFVLGSLFLYIFSKYALGLTVGRWVPFDQDPGAHVKAIVLPVLTLSLIGIGTVAAVTRQAVLALSEEDFVFAAKARGRTTGQIVRRHMLRNSGVPVVTIVGVYLGYLLGGSILVEQLYSIPGVGRYIFQAVQGRDYPVVQSGVLLIAASFVLINMVTDIAYGILDPRIRALSS